MYALGREQLFIVACFPNQMVAMTKVVAADSKIGVLCLVIPNTGEYATYPTYDWMPCTLYLWTHK